MESFKSDGWKVYDKTVQNLRVMSAIINGSIAAADKSAKVIGESMFEDFTYDVNLSLTMTLSESKEEVPFDLQDWNQLWFWALISQLSKTRPPSLFKIEGLRAQASKANEAYEFLKKKDGAGWDGFISQSLTICYDEKRKRPLDFV
jgi:hypothetical protein